MSKKRKNKSQDHISSKGKIDIFRCIKIKTFSVSKGTNNRVKMQPKKWEKIFTNHISDKGPIPRIYFLKLLQLNNNNKNKTSSF